MPGRRAVASSGVAKLRARARAEAIERAVGRMGGRRFGGAGGSSIRAMGTRLVELPNGIAAIYFLLVERRAGETIHKEDHYVIGAPPAAVRNVRPNPDYDPATDPPDAAMLFDAIEDDELVFEDLVRDRLRRRKVRP